MCSLLYFSHMFTSVQCLIRIAVSLFPHRVAGVCASLCHAEIPETFPDAAADHTLPSLNSPTRCEETRRRAGATRHQVFPLVCVCGGGGELQRWLFLLFLSHIFAQMRPLPRSNKRRRRRIASLLVKWRGASLLRNGERNAFFSLASHFSTWTAPGVVTRKREALKVADVSWFVMSEMHGERNRQTQPITAREAGITTKRARFKCHGSSCLMGASRAATRLDQAVCLDIWTPHEQLDAINQSNIVSQSNVFTLR